METHPSRGRAIAGAATAGQGISPSDCTRSLYIAPRILRNAHNITARELKPAVKTAMNSTETTFLENRWKARKQDTLWYHTKRPSFCIAYIPQHNITPPLRWRAFASWRNVEESPSATQNKRSSSGRLW